MSFAWLITVPVSRQDQDGGVELRSYRLVDLATGDVGGSQPPPTDDEPVDSSREKRMYDNSKKEIDIEGA
jgi:hypothetical protein